MWERVFVGEEKALNHKTMAVMEPKGQKEKERSSRASWKEGETTAQMETGV